MYAVDPLLSVLTETCLLYYLKVEPKDLPDTNSVDKQYVYLVAKSDDAHFQFHKEARILLSYRDGMVFIQTDKPIYTPRQKGRNVLNRIIWPPVTLTATNSPPCSQK